MRNRIGRKRAIALQIAYRLIEQGMTAGDDGVGLLQRQRKACAVDAEKNVATAHLLIVPHHDIGHEARHVWRDFNDIGADAAIARPGFIHVVNP